MPKTIPPSAVVSTSPAAARIITRAAIVRLFPSEDSVFKALTLSIPVGRDSVPDRDANICTLAQFVLDEAFPAILSLLDISLHRSGSGRRCDTPGGEETVSSGPVSGPLVDGEDPAGAVEGFGDRDGGAAVAGTDHTMSKLVITPRHGSFCRHGQDRSKEGILEKCCGYKSVVHLMSLIGYF